MDWDAVTIEFTQVRSAITEGRQVGQLSFCNHLLIDIESEPQLHGRTLIDGSEIPQSHMDEIRSLSNQLTEEINWQKGDLLMLDNKRFMHGRRAFDPNDDRDIVVIQTARASFGYGSTTRRALR